MANITASWQTSLESLPDAPDEQWVQSIVNRSNVFDRQVATAFQGGISINGNTTSTTKDITLVHGQSVTVANPLNVPIQGIFAIACVGLAVGSDGRPNGGIYDLAIPALQASPSTRGDGSWVVQASYAFMPSETVGVPGEVIGPISRVQSAAVNFVASGSVTNVCAQPSITITPGAWRILGHAGFTAAATTTVSAFQAGVNKTSNTLGSTDLRGVPTAGEYRTNLGSTATITTGGVAVFDLIYDASFTANTDLYLVVSANFAASTLGYFGSLQATRIAPYLTGRTGRVKLWFFGG